MNGKKESRDQELRALFSSLPRIKVPDRTVRDLKEKLRVEGEATVPSGVRTMPLRLARRRVVIAVFAALLIAVPVTYRIAVRYAARDAGDRTYVVRFVYEDEDAERVCLVGDFNNWRRDDIVLEKMGASTLWVAEITLEEGLYKYGFLVDDVQIVSDPFSDLKTKDSLGNESSLMVLADVRGNGDSL